MFRLLPAAPRQYRSGRGRPASGTTRPSLPPAVPGIWAAECRAYGSRRGLLVDVASAVPRAGRAFGADALQGGQECIGSFVAGLRERSHVEYLAR